MIASLTKDRKKKFLITMVIIMTCATAVNYGLFNILNTHFKHDDVYNAVQVNILSVVFIIGIVTVIMVILIPKENVNQILSDMEEENKGLENNN